MGGRSYALRLLHVSLTAVLLASVCEAKCGTELLAGEPQPLAGSTGHHHHSSSGQHPVQHSPGTEKHACNLDHAVLEAVACAAPLHRLSGNLPACVSQSFPSPLQLAVDTSPALGRSLDRRFPVPPTTLRI